MNNSLKRSGNVSELTQESDIEEDAGSSLQEITMVNTLKIGVALDYPLYTWLKFIYGGSCWKYVWLNQNIFE